MFFGVLLRKAFEERQRGGFFLVGNFTERFQKFYLLRRRIAELYVREKLRQRYAEHRAYVL